MNIDKRARSELKTYFVTHAIPTENNFAEMVDAMLNQKDDGLVKASGSPLSVEAVGDETSQRKLLSFYEAFADDTPTWTLGLRPRQSPQDPLTGRRGLGVSTGAGVCRLFLDALTGSVGIGTVDPQSLLHVAGDARVAGRLRVAGGIEAAAPATVLELAGDVEIVNKLKSPLLQEDWRPATLEGSWAVYGDGFPPPAFFKDSMGTVLLRGMVKGGANNTLMFRLPEGYQPERTLSLCVNRVHVAGRIDIYPNGDVWAVDVSSAWTNLDGLSFRAWRPTDALALLNGNFEDGIAAGSFVTLYAGDLRLTGWTIGGGGIDIIGTFWQPATGTRSLDLNAGSPGWIEQMIRTVIGATYKVTFALAGSSTGAPTVKTMTVSATGGQVQTYSFDVTGKTTTAMGWRREEYTFTATSTLTALRFTSTTTGACGPALDDVAIARVA